MMEKARNRHLDVHLLFCLQRGELEMYIDVGRCISEMADSEINRIVQTSKVITFE